MLYLAAKDRLPPLVSVRSTKVGDTLAQAYRLKPSALRDHVKKLLDRNVSMDDLLFDESAPDKDVVLQAEIAQSSNYVDMRYAICSGVGMRDAYLIMQHTHGAVANWILKEYLDSPSHDMLEWILQNYPGYVIELSVYPYSVGVLKWNTLFWEVRNW